MNWRESCLGICVGMMKRCSCMLIEPVYGPIDKMAFNIEETPL